MPKSKTTSKRDAPAEPGVTRQRAHTTAPIVERRGAKPQSVLDLVALADQPAAIVYARLDGEHSRGIYLTKSEVPFIRRVAGDDPSQLRIWQELGGLVPPELLATHVMRTLYWAVLAYRQSELLIFGASAQREKNEAILKTIGKLGDMIRAHPLLRDAVWSTKVLHSLSSRSTEAELQQELLLTAVPRLSWTIDELRATVEAYLPDEVAAHHPKVSGARMIRFREIMFDYLLDTYGAAARKPIQHIAYGLCVAAFPEDAAEYLSPEATDTALRKRIRKRAAPT